MSELRGCPFCGGDVDLTRNTYGWAIKCDYCETITELYGPKASVIAKWNRRAKGKDTVPVSEVT